MLQFLSGTGLQHEKALKSRPSERALEKSGLSTSLTSQFLLYSDLVDKMTAAAVPTLASDTYDERRASYETDTSADKDNSSSVVDKRSTDKATAWSAEDLLPPLTESSRFTDILLRRNKEKAHDPNAIATRQSIYDDPVLRKLY